MKRTLHVLSLNRQAGVEIMFVRFLEQLAKENPELLENQVVYALSLSEFFKAKLEKLGVRYILKKENKFSFFDFKKITDLIKRENISNIYGHNFNGNTWAALLGAVCKKKVICHEHGTAWKASGLTLYLTYFWTRVADVIICNSKASQVIITKRFKVNKAKTVLIYNGVPRKSPLNLDKDSNLLLFVGRLEPVKSPQTLLHAVKLLAETRPTIKLAILGDGVLKDELKNLSKELGISDNVDFIGHVEHPDIYMAKAALLLLPSIRESLGNVIIEAGFQNTSCIGTNVDGIAEVILNGETGVLIKPEIHAHYNNIEKYVVDPSNSQLTSPKALDPYTLSKNIEKILDDNLYIDMGMKSNKYVSSKFEINQYYSNIKELLV